jgi:hypothetical protein
MRNFCLICKKEAILTYKNHWELITENFWFCYKKHHFHHSCVTNNISQLKNYFSCEFCFGMLTKQENIPSCLLCGKNNQADSNSCKKYKNLCLPCIFEKILNKALIENYHIKDCEGCRIYFENNSKQCNTCKVYKKTNDMLLTPRCKTHYYCENCINKRRIETLTYQKCQNCAGFFNSIRKN